MSCSHLLILNRHVFLNTSDCRRAKYSCEWILCGTDIKLWTLLQYGEQADGAARRCNKPQSQRSISHQLVVRKAFLLTSHPEYQTVQSGRSQSRISFLGGVQKVLWQLWVSGPSSADTTGGHRDIKQLREKRRSITSDNCSQNFFFFFLSTAWFLMNMQNKHLLYSEENTWSTQTKRMLECILPDYPTLDSMKIKAFLRESIERKRQIKHVRKTREYETWQSEIWSNMQLLTYTHAI